MASHINDGGPAFAGTRRIQRAGYDTNEFEPVNGMSLRDYFIAHAPTEPQSWFQPVMPEHPVRPVFPEQGEEGERSYVREFDSVMDAEEIRNPELRAYVVAIQAYQPLANEWRQEAQKQRYLQWPYAWADAMLKARQS